jgi:signal transduction histidine kinase
VNTPRLSSKGSVRLGLVFAIAVAAIAVAADVATGNEFLVSILYFIPLVFIARLKNTTTLWMFAVVMVALSFMTFRYGGSGAAMAAALVNRGLAAITILFTAGILDRQIRLDLDEREKSDLLGRRNRELEDAHEEITAREEEIARQNEELQSQTEELERQAEELRLSNEDLAVREKTVEQLLELSRSLTPDLRRDEVMRKVCDSLGVLTAGTAAAILERREGEMHVVCHAGFGDEIESHRIPLQKAFGHLVLSAGQTGFLEDVTRRPDLTIVQPARGPRMRSVLSTPIRIGHRAFGTVEVYGAAPQRWNEGQVSTIESVAAQLAISLQNFELMFAIDAERRKFEAAFRSVPIGLLLVPDPEGKEIRINPAGALLLGVSLDDNLSPRSPVGARILRGVFRDGKPVEIADLPTSRALRGEEVAGEELEQILPSGRHLNLMVGAAPFHDAEGKVTGAVAVFLDQTAHKSALRELELRRREAEEASVRKTRFLAAISHDIRTPANAINLATELLRRAADDPAFTSRIPEIAARLETNVKSMLSLVEDLLDLSRFDSGKSEIVESEFSLNELLEEEGQQFRPSATARSLELIVEPAPAPVWLHTDRVKLARVIGNLVENAIKFTLTGAVKLHAELGPENDRFVRIQVSDTGIGIAAEYLPRIFDEFLQLRNVARDPSRGSGLGLAICKRLVGLLGGEIDVTSELGKGTTFTVLLPASRLAMRLDSFADPRHQSRKSQVPRLGGLKVLVVEDHATTREGIRDLLEQEGAQVSEAATGASGIAQLLEGPPDVLLLDLMLPDIDGSEVLKAAREIKTPPRRVLVLTGDLREDRLRALEPFSPDAVIQKPVDIELLVTALQALVRPSTRAAEA